MAKRSYWDKLKAGDSHKKYDPQQEGYGSKSQWQSAAGGEWVTREDDTPLPKVDADMALLGLSSIPRDASILTRAFRKAAFAAHPDTGGSHAAFLALRAAFNRMSRRI